MTSHYDYWIGLIKEKIDKYVYDTGRKPSKIIIPNEVYNVLNRECVKVFGKKAGTRIYGIDMMIVHDSIDITCVAEID